MASGTVELLIDASRLARRRVLALVDGLDDAQLGTRPMPRAHSLGWTLWHLARSADAYRSELPAWPGHEERRQLWERERIAAAWRIGPEFLGTLSLGSVDVDDATAARLPLPDRERVVDYARRAFAELDAAVGLIDERRFGETFDSIIADGRITIGGWLLAALAHDNRHLGEMEYAKGLLGLRGTATR